jgi:hypothetical protein
MLAVIAGDLLKGALQRRNSAEDIAPFDHRRISRLIRLGRASGPVIVVASPLSPVLRGREA